MNWGYPEEDGGEKGVFRSKTEIDRDSTENDWEPAEIDREWTEMIVAMNLPMKGFG